MSAEYKGRGRVDHYYAKVLKCREILMSIRVVVKKKTF